MSPVSKKAVLATVVVGLFVALFLLFGDDLRTATRSLIHGEMPPALFLLLFLILPLLGAPVLPFYVLLGIRFDIFWGVLLMTVMLPIHLAFSYVLAVFALRPLVESIAGKWEYAVPTVPRDRAIWFSFLFMAAPGPSYAMKNYLLALSGVSFGCYFIIGWIIQGIWGLPFIVLGEAAHDGGSAVFAILLILLVGGYFFQRWIRNKYRENAAEMTGRSSSENSAEPLERRADAERQGGAS